MRRRADWAAALTRPARQETWPAKTWSTCSTGWGSRAASTSGSWLRHRRSSHPTSTIRFLESICRPARAARRSRPLAARYNDRSMGGRWIDGWFVVPHQVIFRDLDAIGHVNNAVFFTFFEWARTLLWFD